MNGVIDSLKEKGFGFIKTGEGKRGVFFHKSALQNAKFEDLHPGMKVEFEIEQAEKGPRAENIFVE